MSEQETYIIRKYSNRRLYDTQKSCYITLEVLRDMVLDGIDFRVLTSKGEDITSSTLISLLISGEVMGEPVFSEQGLRNMVMFMHGPMRGPVKVLFEQCMPIFQRGHEQITEKFGPLMSNKELENVAALQGRLIRQLMEQYVCRGLENYLEAQKNIEKMATFHPFNFPNFFNQNNKED